MPEPERLLDTEEIAERLKITRLYVTELCREGALPGAFKMGRVWRMRETDFTEHLRRLSTGEADAERPREDGLGFDLVNPLEGFEMNTDLGDAP